jgi:hypothetical protein
MSDKAEAKPALPGFSVAVRTKLGPQPRNATPLSAALSRPSSLTTAIVCWHAHRVSINCSCNPIEHLPNQQQSSPDKPPL